MNDVDCLEWAFLFSGCLGLYVLLFGEWVMCFEAYIYIPYLVGRYIIYM